MSFFISIAVLLPFDDNIISFGNVFFFFFTVVMMNLIAKEIREVLLDMNAGIYFKNWCAGN